MISYNLLRLASQQAAGGHHRGGQVLSKDAFEESSQTKNLIDRKVAKHFNTQNQKIGKKE